MFSAYFSTTNLGGSNDDTDSQNDDIFFGHSIESFANLLFFFFLTYFLCFFRKLERKGEQRDKDMGLVRAASGKSNIWQAWKSNVALQTQKSVREKNKDGASVS